jgi:hypothetical protein
MRTEAGRVLHHLATHGGKVDLSDAAFAARPMSFRNLDYLAWEDVARTVLSEAEARLQADA